MKLIFRILPDFPIQRIHFENPFFSIFNNDDDKYNTDSTVQCWTQSMDMDSKKDCGIISGRLIPRWLNWFPRKAYPEEIKLVSQEGLSRGDYIGLKHSNSQQYIDENSRTYIWTKKFPGKYKLLLTYMYINKWLIIMINGWILLWIEQLV